MVKGICACGCYQRTKQRPDGTYNRYLIGHNRAHGKSDAQRMTEYLNNNPIPLCECGCGGKVKFYHGKPNRFLLGHNKGARTKLTEEERKAKRVQYRKNAQAAMTKRWVEKNGPLPLCKCGCGQPVKIKSDGEPSQYASLGCYNKTDNKKNSGRKSPLETEEASNYIPIADFRSAVTKLKQARGWTWKQMADKAQISQSQLAYLVYSDRQKSVSKEWAKGFFTRLAGIPTTPTPYQLKKLKKLNRLEMGLENRE